MSENEIPIIAWIGLIVSFGFGLFFFVWAFLIKFGVLPDKVFG